MKDSEAKVSMDVETVLDLADALVYVKSGLETGHLVLSGVDKDSSKEATAELTDAIGDLAKQLTGLIVDAAAEERRQNYGPPAALQVVVDEDMRVLNPQKFSEAMKDPKNTIVIIPPEPIEA